MSNHEPQTYVLESAPMIHTPGFIRWCIAGYRPQNTKPDFVAILTEGYNLPEHVAVALLKRQIPYTVENDTVVVTWPGSDNLAPWE